VEFFSFCVGAEEGKLGREGNETGFLCFLRAGLWRLDSESCWLVFKM